MNNIFDLAIIGGGPAGYTAAERATHLGLSVVLFERSAMGGVCLNEGCIPTKTLLYSAKIYSNALHGTKYGVSAENVVFDYSKVVARKNKIVRKLNAGIRAKMTANKVNVVVGNCCVSSYSEKEIEIACNEQNFKAKNLLLCNGSSVAIPPIKGTDSTDFLTSKEALEQKEIPQSIVIVGGGVIGMEFAGLFNTFGSKVSVVEMADEILPPVDSEIASALREDYSKKGVNFFLSAKVTAIKNNEVMITDNEGNEKTLETEKILLCVGRKPSLEGIDTLQLEMYGGGIKVNEKMQTSLRNVYAAGDITGFSMLAHTAVREAEVAVNNIADKMDMMHYNAVPAVVYTNPEVAGVGKTEDELKNKNVRYFVKKLPMTFSGRFVAENEGSNGICKIIFDENNRVIGAHLIGNPASELIVVAAFAIEQKVTVEEFKKLIFPHPSVGEIFKETLFE